MDLQKTGRFIASLRKEHGWTQKDLAERVGVTDKAVSRWETGRGFPDVSCLPALADALEVPISELVRGERMELEGKKPAEIMEQVEQAVVNTVELSRKSTGRDRAAAAVLFLAGTAVFYPEFYVTLTDVELLRYDFSDTVVYEVLFKLLPLSWALTVSVNTICVAFQILRRKK